MSSNQRWFMAGVGSSILRGGIENVQDAAVAIVPWAVSNQVAPAGMGGECLFGNLYLTVTHQNPTMWVVTVQPIVDGTLLDPITLDIPAVAGDVVEEVFELSLMQAYLETAVEQTRYAPRGQWIRVRITAATAPDGRVAFDGVEGEFEVLQEGKMAANA